MKTAYNTIEADPDQIEFWGGYYICPVCGEPYFKKDDAQECFENCLEISDQRPYNEQ